MIGSGHGGKEMPIGAATALRLKVFLGHVPRVARASQPLYVGFGPESRWDSQRGGACFELGKLMDGVWFKNFDLQYHKIQKKQKYEK